MTPASRDLESTVADVASATEQNVKCQDVTLTLTSISWATIIWGGDYAWIVAIPYSNTARSLPGQLEQYDAATENSVDRYLAARAAYLQYRDAVSRRK